MSLNPLESRKSSFEFYFPTTGKFSIYPATVVKEDKILCTANIKKEIEVLEK